MVQQVLPVNVQNAVYAISPQLHRSIVDAGTSAASSSDALAPAPLNERSYSR